MATDNSDLYNFRAGNNETKKEFQQRTEKLKEKNISPRDIYEAGLMVFEAGNTEQQLLFRRNKTITERDVFFNLFIDRNIKISALNRMLRNKNNRYNDFDDNKDVIKLFNKDGAELQTVPLNDDGKALKNEIEKR